MRACGCGDFQPDFKFKGPDNTWYVLQSYPSCKDCDTPTGIILYLFDQKDASMWGLENVKEIPIPSEGRLIPVLHPRKLKNKLITWLLETAQYTADELIEKCFVDAVHESFDDIKQD